MQVNFFFIELFFSIRQFFNKIRKPNIKLILIDLDGTILKDFSTLEEGLKIIYGKKTGAKRYSKVMTMIINKEATAEDLMIHAENQLIDGKFSKNTLAQINKKMIKKIDYSLIKAIKDNVSNKKIIVATKSSNVLAYNIAKRFSFFSGVGTNLAFHKNGLMKKSLFLVSDHNKIYVGHKFRTKLELAIDCYKAHEGQINEKEVAIITDAITDLNTMKKCGLTILVKGKKPNVLQLICEKYKLYDILIQSEQDYSKLKQI